MPPDQTILQSNQNSILTQRQINRSKDQIREPRSKLICIWSSDTTKEAKMYNGKKTVSSISVAGKTG